MEFTIAKEEFLRGLSRTQSIIEKKSTLPVLSNVLINAQTDGLELAATDLEVSVKGVFEASVKTPGVVTLPAKRLFEIVRELPAGDVHVIGQDNAWVTIKYANGEMLLSGLVADDFPGIPAFDDEGFATFEAADLLDMIDKTSFAISTDETRYYLNGIYVEAGTDPATLRMVATDGHRLSMVLREMPAAAKLDVPEGVILPRKGVNELRRMLGDVKGEVELGIRDRNAVVKSGDSLLSIRLIDGEFPDYNRVIPQGNDKTIVLDRDAFLSALKRISIVSQEMTRGVKFAVTPGNLEISSNNPSLGEAKESMPVTYTGDELEIGFNAKFFIDVLGVIASGEVRIELNDDLSPALVKAEKAEGLSAVIMPMRL